MSRINSKNKGSCFEREIAHLLTETFGKQFNRTPGSGSFTGGKNRVRALGLSAAANTTLTGDLIVPKGFPYSIECKNYASIAWHQVIHGECKQLDSWISQAKDDAQSIGLIPLIIIKINRNGTFFVMPSVCEHQLQQEPSIPRLTYKDHTIYSMDFFNKIIDVQCIKVLLSD